MFNLWTSREQVVTTDHWEVWRIPMKWEGEGGVCFNMRDDETELERSFINLVAVIFIFPIPF